MKKKKNSKEFNARFKKKFLTPKSLAIIVFTVFILGILTIGCLHTCKKQQQLQAVIDQYTRENEELRKGNEEIEEEKQRIQDMNQAMLAGKDDEESEESIREIARNVLGMVDGDEYFLQEETGDQAD